MKKSLYIAISLIAFNCFGQKMTEKIAGLSITNQKVTTEKDSIIKVFYIENKDIENIKKPAYFINGTSISEGILKTLNQDKIESITVEKESVEIENIKYYGKIYIVTKSTYKPNFISLNNLKLKYTNLKDNSIIFQIDNEIINANYENFLVDENNILKIMIENFENKKEKWNITFIRLITKSEENIKKSNKIILRG